MKWSDDITHLMDMNLSKLLETVEGRGAWRAAVYGVAKSLTQLSDWTTMCDSPTTTPPDQVFTVAYFCTFCFQLNLGLSPPHKPLNSAYLKTWANIQSRMCCLIRCPENWQIELDTFLSGSLSYFSEFSQLPVTYCLLFAIKENIFLFDFEIFLNSEDCPFCSGLSN